MKVFRIEHMENGLGPFIGPSSTNLFNYLATKVYAGVFPDSKHINNVTILDYFAVKSLKELKDWFDDRELLQMLQDEGYHIVIYKTKSISHDDGKQLTFRKNTASRYKCMSLNLFLEID
jgi:hypothetical protein